MNNKTKSKFLLALKLVFALIYIGLTIWLAWGLIDVVATPSENTSLSVALYLSFVIIIFGVIGYAIALIPAIIGLIATIIKRDRGNIIFFLCAVVLPIITEVVFILLGKALA